MNLLALTAILLAGIPVQSSGAQFPSAASSKSPDRRWEVTRKSPEDNSGHLLVLTRIGRASVELRRFGRHCSTLWSEDSSHLAVTDWLGSNMSDVFIYSVTNAATGKSLADLIPNSAIPREELGGHCYFEATKWIDPHHLRVRVFGHTDQARGRSFEHVYMFNIRTGNFEQLGKSSPKIGAANGSQPIRSEPIASGCFLISVDGTNVVTRSAVDAMSMVRGPVGKVVILEIADAARTTTNKFTVTRGRAVIRDNQVVEITE